MSYCRFGDSDTYIYGDASGGYTCCACWLHKKPFGSKNFKTIFGLLVHCLNHSTRKHRIPKYVYKRIAREIFKLQWTSLPIKGDK